MPAPRPPARERGRTAAGRNEAAEFLVAGPVPSTDILEGVSQRTHRRAKKHLGVTAHRGEDGTTWHWELPIPEDE